MTMTKKNKEVLIELLKQYHVELKGTEDAATSLGYELVCEMTESHILVVKSLIKMLEVDIQLID